MRISNRSLSKAITLALVTALFSTLAIGPLPVLASDQYTFKGYGYGHGIGMCQWGARGRADQGQDYKQILTHYYQSTQITGNYSVPPTVRVRLFDKANLTEAYLEPDVGGNLDFIKTDGTYAYQGGTGRWTISPGLNNTLTLVNTESSVTIE